MVTVAAPETVLAVLIPDVKLPQMSVTHQAPRILKQVWDLQRTIYPQDKLSEIETEVQVELWKVCIQIIVLHKVNASQKLIIMGSFNLKISGLHNQVIFNFSS